MFKILQNAILVYVILCLLQACGTRYYSQPMHENDIVELVVLTDKNLNFYNEYPHAIVLSVYQARSIELIQALYLSKSTFSAVETTLNNSEHISRLGRYTFLPNEYVKLSLNTTADAKYVFLTAGYFRQPSFNHFSRLYELKRYDALRPWSYFTSGLGQRIYIQLGKNQIQGRV